MLEDQDAVRVSALMQFTEKINKNIRNLPRSQSDTQRQNIKHKWEIKQISNMYALQERLLALEM